MPGCELVNVRLLTGATPNAERAETLAGLADGSVHILIGTHALIQPDVQFAHLGFVVVDEQHRFGVEQRGALRQKGKGISPHMLIMTATPIPRTLALTRYADLDLTILDEMPPGRTPIGTRVLEHKEREAAYHFIRRHIENGRQAFIVYPLVEQSESENLSEVRSAVEEHERLQRDVFPDLKLGLLHGKMSPSEKDEVMATFSRNDTQILVCTSVVEVGIDVPNATVILIEGANRFGLAQLHQFRGRVGRGQYASVCLLIPDEPGENERLKAMEETTDGFKLAQKDYELRGAGDLLGTRQSGGVDLGAQMNPQLVEAAQIEARTIYEEDPTLVLAEHIALREVVRMRYGEERSAEVS
jgi:ATP-dependent DNA helicase RecG